MVLIGLNTSFGLSVHCSDKDERERTVEKEESIGHIGRLSFD
jgi:hypothetical protein